MDLRGHIVESSELCVQVALAVPALRRSSETKVSNLQVVVLVQEQVLGLEISVSDLLVVAEVQAGHELFEIVSCLGLIERSGVRNEIEKLTALGYFQYDI